MNEIVDQLYGKDGVTHSLFEIVPRVQAIIQKLSLWVAGLPISLTLLPDSNICRSCLLLHMMYNQVSTFQ